MAQTGPLRGMTKKDVRRELGPPHSRTTAGGHFRRYGGVAGLGRLFGRGAEYWYYRGVPDEEHETMVTFAGRRVVEVLARGIIHHDPQP